MFPGRNVYGEDAMTSGGRHIHRRLSDHPVCVAEEEEIESLLFRVREMERKIFQVNIVIRVFHRRHWKAMGCVELDRFGCNDSTYRTKIEETLGGSLNLKVAHLRLVLTLG